ncbi:cobalamin B12-binding domain-containing protein [Streptomyces fructofermentans]|uniref:Cobalamin-binding protein n=1 Tax=Streptomyces fructofermentans TaxID=152141 RepID=A0A918U2Q1_9ACTN|nr:cobalamin-dependent protein [Streptomyces fructofermentans]GGX85160.1 cobalamin-binding protein [Streptomyces fructofermentans]
MTTVSDHPAARMGLDDARHRLWAAVRTGDESAAYGVARDALESGWQVEEVLLDLIAAVQVKVGTEWAADRMTVAQEHTATAIHERVVAAVAHHRAVPAAPHRGRVTVACVDGDWHALPARLLAEVLRQRGWQPDFLGAHVPTPHLVAHLHRTGPRAVALSASISTHLPTAHAAITACRATGVPVVAGGAAFGPGGRYARALGADLWAPDARSAAEALEGGIAGHRPAVAGPPADDLRHLADQEYTYVAGNGRRLVRETLARLADRFPPMRDYSDRQRERTAEDIAHIVDHLGTALYVGDGELFTGFIGWTADILEARNVPAVCLHPALDLLADQLKDFPRALHMLAEARAALASRTSAPTTPGPGKRA